MQIIKVIFLFLCIYIYLYNPIFRIFGFGLIKILLIFSVVYLLVNNKYYLLLKYFKKEILFTLLLIAYSLCLITIGDGTATTVPYSHFMWFLESFFIPIFIFIYFKEILFKISIINVLIIVGTIASFITLYLLFDNNFNIFLRQTVILDSLDRKNTIIIFRGFSIAENSTFSYGIIQGLILSMCLIYIKKSFLYIFPILPLFVSIMVNARIGIFSVIATIILLIIYAKVSKTKILIGIIFIVVIVNIFSKTEMFYAYDKTIEWGKDIFKQTISLISGNNNNRTYDRLFKDMIFIPNSTTGILFGEGRKVFANEKQDSDVGYINQVFIGGIIYIFIMICYFIYMFKRNKKYENNIIYPIIFILTIFVVNMKGNSWFVPNGFIRLYMLYYIYCIIFVNRTSRLNDNSLQLYYKLNKSNRVLKSKLLE